MWLTPCDILLWIFYIACGLYFRNPSSFIFTLYVASFDVNLFIAVFTLHVACGLRNTVFAVLLSIWFLTYRNLLLFFFVMDGVVHDRIRTLLFSYCMLLVPRGIFLLLFLFCMLLVKSSRCCFSTACIFHPAEASTFYTLHVLYTLQGLALLFVPSMGSTYYNCFYIYSSSTAFTLHMART